MTWNVLYGGAGREELIDATVRQLTPDIAVFTEARTTRSFERVADVVGPHRVAGGNPGDNAHVMIASQWPIVRSARFGPFWSSSKWVVASVQVRSSVPITVVGVHLVPHLLWPFELVRAYEVRALLNHLANEKHHLIAGDFNALSVGDGHRLSMSAWWVRAQWLLQAGATARWATRQLIEAGYLDCYRASNPNSDGFTVPAWDPQARIDYLFASRGSALALRSSGVGHPTGSRAASTVPRRSFAQLLGRTPVGPLNGQASDHLPVWADFEWTDAP